MSKRKKHLTEFLFINLGFFIAAMGITNFLGPAKFTAGGFTGLAILINTLFSNFSIGQAMLLLNIPVFILGALIIDIKIYINPADITPAFTAPIPSCFKTKEIAPINAKLEPKNTGTIFFVQR